MAPKTDIEYVELFANKLKEDNSLFSQQKKLIENQLKISSDLFKNMCGKEENFKTNARTYLKGIGLL